MSEHELGPLPAPEIEADTDGCTYACPEGYTADQMRAYALAEVRRAVAIERDCRTCRHFRGTQHCHSVLRCIEGSSYQRGGVVQLWETAPADAGF